MHKFFFSRSISIFEVVCWTIAANLLVRFDIVLGAILWVVIVLATSYVNTKEQSQLDKE